MLKFFRNIRRRLLASNKLKAYTLYGIGEVVLVVIGILIALQINNWNEARKERLEEEKILLGIKEDFLETRGRLRSTMQAQESVLNYSRRLVNLIENNTWESQMDSIPKYMNRGALAFFRAEPVMGTYDALIGSGKLSIIQNSTLLKALTDFSSLAGLPFEDEERSMNLLQLMDDCVREYPAISQGNGTMNPFGFTFRYPEEKRKEQISQLCQNIPFLTHLKRRLAMESFRLTRQKILLSATNSVLNELGVKDGPNNSNRNSEYPGLYEEKGSEVELEIRKEGLNLFAQDSDQRRFEMIFFEHNLFYVSPYNRKIRFWEEGGRVSGLSFYENEVERQFRKRN